MKFENTWTGNFEGAFRGMRFPMNSGNKADTKWYEDIIENERKCFNQCIDVRPEEAMFLAIKGMLPHTKLGRQMIKKVRVYAGSEHENAAQKPEVWEVK